ncbi:NUDIX hydrolase [Gordonibacter massiliensis (ex Traore et al. 2017)]|uniref:NUDIX domain-containing protein n=1 Tax=Gordonibacter massiliensis (ex Traore et al. 2017) TaxID=1841863 RepID=A0A842JJB0_9ACTN|nr:NUDIX domain-containing protein [Gordonibacter massiliensis (ex Traore et al. 2017)]MBC2890561.1 NUDIX domain-containing protein [Gordonibacter massiliensis (ex Traore et al. 2017)]
MDVTYSTSEGRFNYRVGAVAVDEGQLLVMRDWHCPYLYLPGGKVELHETAEDAVLRELREEMRAEARIVRPLWLSQAFFTEDASGERFHELCLYFLVSLPDSLSASHGETFSCEESGRRNAFFWLPFEQLEREYLYPSFIKSAIFDLPEHLELVSEVE